MAREQQLLHDVRTRGTRGRRDGIAMAAAGASVGGASAAMGAMLGLPTGGAIGMGIGAAAGAAASRYMSHGGREQIDESGDSDDDSWQPSGRVRKWYCNYLPYYTTPM